MLTPEDFFDISTYAHQAVFAEREFVWDALKHLEHYLESTIEPGIHGTVHKGAYLMGDQIQIGKGTVVEPGAYIQGPAIIGDHSLIRQGAYIRGNVLIGDRCTIGHATEVKSAIFLDHSGAPHFNYVGDSILGRHVNLGAGTKLSNLKITEGSVRVKINQHVYDSGLRKFGAIMGDHSATGCNAVLNPGTLIGRGSLVYPCATVSGYVPPKSLVKLRQKIDIAARR